MFHATVAFNTTSCAHAGDGGIEILITRDENLPLMGIDGWADTCTGTKVMTSRAKAIVQAQYLVRCKNYLEKIGTLF